jgi:transcriptional regulator with PAS, ATPase and Fis domain
LQPIRSKGPCARIIRRLGDDKDREVDVRIIAATNRDPHQAIAERLLREDLYYRLASLTIALPPLRDRKSDIPMIAENILGEINRQFAADEPGYEHKTLSASTIAFVKKHDWPGNVRQLQNVLVQAAVLAEGNTLHPGDLKAVLGEMPHSAASQNVMQQTLGGAFSLEEHLNNIQRHFLRRAMEESRGVKAQAARLLGIRNYQTLDGQLERLDVRGNWET